MARHWRIGARGSKLSLAQTGWARDRFAACLGVDAGAIEIVTFTTTGDRVQDRKLIEVGGKGLFTKELDDALLDGRIDAAVHSLKDVPTRLPDDIVLAATPEREDPREAFLSRTGASLLELPPGARIGAASLRRQAQTLAVRPDLSVVTLRGNVDTRLAKLAAGDVDATYLALAGLKRLGLTQHLTAVMDPNAMIPAPAQGALAVTARANDHEALTALALLDHAATRLEIEAERSFLAALDGSCRTPIAALARVADGRLRFAGETLQPDGGRRWRRDAEIDLGPQALEAARALGARLGAEIVAEGGRALLDGA